MEVRTRILAYSPLNAKANSKNEEEGRTKNICLSSGFIAPKGCKFHIRIRHESSCFLPKGRKIIYLRMRVPCGKN
jgi:hypothetical protein